MRQITIALLVVAALTGAAAYLLTPTGSAAGEASPIFGIRLPAAYRDWRLISVAREEGSLDDIRAILGNDLAIEAYRQGKLPFPDGAMIARVAWAYSPSDETTRSLAVFNHS